MALLSLREAAQQAGTSKSTILRAIQSGRLSAGRTDAGGYAIDPAELFRVYAPKPSVVAPERSADQGTGQTAMAGAPNTVAPDELALRMATLEAELKGMQALLVEVKQARDDWKAQAERLAITGPADRRGFWQRLVGG
jgi:excisionase family DNA binding protein